LPIGEYLNGFGVDCLSLKNAQHCDYCEEACCKEGVVFIGGAGSLRKRRKSAASLEAREVQDGADLREMLAEL